MGVAYGGKHVILLLKGQESRNAVAVKVYRHPIVLLIRQERGYGYYRTFQRPTTLFSKAYNPFSDG